VSGYVINVEYIRARKNRKRCAVAGLISQGEQGRADDIVDVEAVNKGRGQF